MEDEISQLEALWNNAPDKKDTQSGAVAEGSAHSESADEAEAEQEAASEAQPDAEAEKPVTEEREEAHEDGQADGEGEGADEAEGDGADDAEDTPEDANIESPKPQKTEPIEGVAAIPIQTAKSKGKLSSEDKNKVLKKREEIANHAPERANAVKPTNGCLKPNPYPKKKTVPPKQEEGEEEDNGVSDESINRTVIKSRPKDSASLHKSIVERQHHVFSEKDHPLILWGLDNHMTLRSIADRVGCSRGALSDYIKRTPILNQAAIDEEETRGDYVESKLFEKFKSGDFGAITFYLTHKCRNRGYGEVQTLEHKTDEKRIVIGHVQVPEKLVDYAEQIAMKMEKSPTMMPQKDGVEANAGAATPAAGGEATVGVVVVPDGDGAQGESIAPTKMSVTPVSEVHESVAQAHEQPQPQGDGEGETVESVNEDAQPAEEIDPTMIPPDNYEDTQEQPQEESFSPFGNGFM